MRAAPLLCALLCASACGPPSLEGSLTELMDLRYRSVEVGASDLGGSNPQVTVKFLTPQGEGENIVLEVTARIRGLTLEPHVSVDLVELLYGTQRGRITRNVLDDPRRTFPALERGRLVLDRVPEQNLRVKGEFSVTFIQGIEFANGRTVFASFEGKVP